MLTRTGSAAAPKIRSRNPTIGFNDWTGGGVLVWMVVCACGWYRLHHS